MTLVPRMAFRCMEPPRHIYIPLWDATRPLDDAVLLVNLTTLRESCMDDACILHPAEYAELTHATTVAYSRAMAGKKTLFLKAIAAGNFIRLSDLPAATWEKILRAAHQTPQLATRHKRLLPVL